MTRTERMHRTYTTEESAKKAGEIEAAKETRKGYPTVLLRVDEVTVDSTFNNLDDNGTILTVKETRYCPVLEWEEDEVDW